MHYNFLEYLALQLDLKRHYTLCFYWDQTFTLKKFKVLKTNGLKSRKKFLLKFVEVKIVIFISPKHRSDCSRVISLIVGFANFLGVWMSEYARTIAIVFTEPMQYWWTQTLQTSHLTHCRLLWPQRLLEMCFVQSKMAFASPEKGALFIP